MAGKRPNPKLQAKDIRVAKSLRKIMDVLRPLHDHKDCPNRKLHFDEFIAYLLLYFFNPIVTSLRGLEQVSGLKTITEKLGLPRFTISSFSEASRVFDPSLLEPLIAELARQARDAGVDPRLAALELAATAVDGTLIRAMPKMTWALWCDSQNRAAKAHVEFSLVDGVPVRATVTDANTSERRVLMDTLTAGKLYVLDAGYVQYALMAAILEAGSSFLVRMKLNCAYEVIEELPISPEAREHGVQRDVKVTLGSANKPELHEKTVRLVEVHVRDLNALLGRPPRRSKMDRKTKSVRTTASDHTVLLATDDLELDATLIADLYRYRWQVELFFRWFKMILSADHLILLSQNGLTHVVYCGLIVSLLIALWTGRKPTKRTYEMLCLYFAGWADEEELEAHIRGLEKNGK